MHGEPAVFGLATLRAPAADWNAEDQGDIEGRPIDACLTAGDNSFERHAADGVDQGCAENQRSTIPTSSSPTLMTAFTLKNARFTRVKSSGRTSQCS